jgi:hypothetical protein
MRSLCACSTPHPQYVTENRPRGDQFCACGGYIDPEWTSNNQTTGRFYNRLASAVPVPGEEYQVFRIDAEARELAGRERFGLSFLGRDNLPEAREEAADGANYFFFDHLQQVRREGVDDDFDLVLIGAHHFYLAHKTARALRARRAGAP